MILKRLRRRKINKQVAKYNLKLVRSDDERLIFSLRVHRLSDVFPFDHSVKVDPGLTAKEFLKMPNKDEWLVNMEKLIREKEQK